MFPHIGGRKWDTVYNDWNYWKPPLPDIEIPLEIYENQSTTPSSPRSSAVTIGSPRLGMIRNLTDSITGSNSNISNNPTISAHGVLESPGNHLLNKTDGNDSVITNQRIVYVGGDVDMPGRMDIYSDENASMVGYDDEIDDGDDEGEYENDDEDDDEGEDDDEIDFDEGYIPTDIDLSSIPY